MTGRAPAVSIAAFALAMQCGARKKAGAMGWRSWRSSSVMSGRDSKERDMAMITRSSSSFLLDGSVSGYVVGGRRAMVKQCLA